MIEFSELLSRMKEDYDNKHNELIKSKDMKFDFIDGNLHLNNTIMSRWAQIQLASRIGIKPRTLYQTFCFDTTLKVIQEVLQSNPHWRYLVCTHIWKSLPIISGFLGGKYKQVFNYDVMKSLEATLANTDYYCHSCKVEEYGKFFEAVFVSDESAPYSNYPIPESLKKHSVKYGVYVYNSESGVGWTQVSPVLLFNDTILLSFAFLVQTKPSHRTNTLSEVPLSFASCIENKVKDAIISELYETSLYKEYFNLEAYLSHVCNKYGLKRFYTDKDICQSKVKTKLDAILFIAANSFCTDFIRAKKLREIAGRELYESEEE